MTLKIFNLENLQLAWEFPNSLPKLTPQMTFGISNWLGQFPTDLGNLLLTPQLTWESQTNSQTDLENPQLTPKLTWRTFNVENISNFDLQRIGLAVFTGQLKCIKCTDT